MPPGRTCRTRRMDESHQHKKLSEKGIYPLQSASKCLPNNKGSCKTKTIPVRTLKERRIISQCCPTVTVDPSMFHWFRAGYLSRMAKQENLGLELTPIHTFLEATSHWNPNDLVVVCSCSARTACVVQTGVNPSKQWMTWCSLLLI